METLNTMRLRRSESQPAGLILNSCTNDEGGDSCVADAKPTAASYTSTGKPFSISIGVAAPPAYCSLHFDWLGGRTPGDSDGKHARSEPVDVRVIAGHDDALLIQTKMRVPNPELRHSFRPTAIDEYYLYEAGSGARPPSLSLLPCFKVPHGVYYRDPTTKFRQLDTENTGILRRGEDDLLVCQYLMTCNPPIYDTAEICMLRIRRDHEWIVKRVPIAEYHEGSTALQQSWHPRIRLVAQAVVPVGNRFLCYVDYTAASFIMFDMAEDKIPKLRYVPLPGPQRGEYCDHYTGKMQDYCNLGAAGPDAVRFVIISAPGCWCSNFPGKISCEGSSSSFSVTTWTMTLSTKEATTWVKDVVLDSDEIRKWRLPNYGCLPRDKRLEYPMVSSDDPDVICFQVEAVEVQINTKSKKLLSVIPGGTRDKYVTANIAW